MNNKLLSKTFNIMIIMLFILTIYTIPTIRKEENVLRTNLEIEDIANIPTTIVYLLDENNLLVQTKIFINTNEKEKIIDNIINYLIEDNKNIPVGLKGYIPKNTRIFNLSIEDNLVKLNMSKEILNTNDIDIVISGIVNSIIKINGIDNVVITAEGNPISYYENVLNKKIGINKNYSYTSRKKVEKTVIYYMEKINEEFYYVPVTKYLNDSREKIEIIIDELKNDKDISLISPLDNKTELLNYKEDNNVLYLNFNEYFLDNNDEINKNIQEMIAYSVFDNYDIDMIMYEVNGKKVNYIEK